MSSPHVGSTCVRKQAICENGDSISGAILPIADANLKYFAKKEGNQEDVRRVWVLLLILTSNIVISPRARGLARAGCECEEEVGEAVRWWGGW